VPPSRASARLVQVAEIQSPTVETGAASYSAISADRALFEGTAPVQSRGTRHVGERKRRVLSASQHQIFPANRDGRSLRTTVRDDVHIPPMRRASRSVLLTLGLLILWHGPLRAQTAPQPTRSIIIPRVERAPGLEDFLQAQTSGSATGRVAQGPVAEPSRLGVRVTDFRQREPGDGVPASEPTTAYLSYDQQNLYVVFVCTDQPGTVRANVARREDIGNDDQVVLYLDTFHDRKRAYSFAVNPVGVQQDGVVTEGQDEDTSFDTVWTSEGLLTDFGYVVRMAIPFRSLRFENESDQTWGIGLGRAIRRNNEESYWPHLTKKIRGFVPQLGDAQGLAQISPARNLQINPYSVLARARVFDDNLPGHVTQGDERVGLDAKAVLRDAFTLDATLNSDFSQVETDDPQVTVNERFEVFFPEKRPFFLENAGYFQTPINLLFSRRIVDPFGGVRLSGKARRWAIGALAMNDRQLDQRDADDHEYGRDIWVGAFRAQREFGKENALGFLVTNQDVHGSPRHARSYSADARWSVGDNWSLTGQLARTETQEREGPRLSDWSMYSKASYDSRAVDYSGTYRQFGPDFDAPLGFVSRVGYRRVDQQIEYAFRPKQKLVTQYGPSLNMKWLWDYSTAALQDREIAPQFVVKLKGKTEVKAGQVRAFELFQGLKFRPYLNQLEFSTEWVRWLGFDVYYGAGTAVNHDPAEEPVELAPFLTNTVEKELGMTVRPTPRLRFEQRFNHTELNARVGSARIASELQSRSKLSYQFNRALSLRAILDYEIEEADPALFDAEEREATWGLDLLLTYLLNPGTAFYVGYTSEYENLKSVGFGRDVIRTNSPGLEVGRQLFVKVNYLWRF
jgi:hypothetical protein